MRARLRALVALSAAILGAAVLAAPGRPAEAYFPGGLRPATEITRDLSLREAAQRGLVRLQAKGGDVGDVVSLELTHKRVPAPITVTVHVEFTIPSRVTDTAMIARVAADMPRFQQLTETELNRGNYRARGGDPIRFKADYVFREPGAPPRPNYHQVTLINPLRDLPEPDPQWRSTMGQGTPNRLGAGEEGRFSTRDLGADTFSHEILHAIGLDDRYSDFYRVGSQEYPLPLRGMPASAVRAWAQSHQPPLPAGDVIVKNTLGTGSCDIMGVGLSRPCRRISRRDLDWIESQAGVQVTAEPGDLLLNKDPERQNFGIGFRTVVFAAPGSVTTANGLSVYCIDKGLFMPLDSVFDVGDPARTLPGYEALAALLELSGRIQPTLTEPPEGFLAAVWNVTAELPAELSGYTDEVRSILAQAGLAENAVPGGLAPLPNPNAASEASGAVGGGAVLPPIASEPTSPPAPRASFALLFPDRVRAGRGVRVDLLASGAGDVSRVTLALERRAGRRWIPVRELPAPTPVEGTVVTSLALGKLRTGRYRVVVTLADAFGASTTVTARLRARS